MAEAIRRFDGGGERSAAAEQRWANGPRSWWSRFDRPQSAALAGGLLVALIALPLAWSSLPDPVREAGRDRRVESPDGAARPAAPGPRLGEPNAPPPAADAAPEPAEPERAGSAPPVPAPMEPASGEVGEAVATGPPLQRRDRASSTPVTSVGSEEIVVTGSRIRRPTLDSAVPITSIGGEEFFQTGKPTRRGDWNACTIDDPRRDRRACRKDVASVARGASGRASTHLAEGLAQAWEGELEEAIGAFDRAIASAPRSASAYLNRGLARQRVGDSEGALSDLDKAIAYAPESARGYYHRGVLLRERGDSKRARADEARAVALDPRYAPLVRAGRKQPR